MDIDRCNSIFEIFTAFNFTYAVLSETTIHNSNGNGSNEPKTYVDIIDNRLLKPFSAFFKKGNDLLEKIITYQETLKTILNKQPPKSADRKKLTDYCSRLDEQKDQSKTWIEQTEEEKRQYKEQINNVFPFVSFCMAIYCIAVLGIGISESSFKHFTLLLLNIFTLIMYLIIVSKKTDNNYVTITVSLLIGIFIITIIHFIIKYYFDKGEEKYFIHFFDTHELAKGFLILSSLLMPFSHFIYYFLRISWKYSRIKKERYKSLDMVADRFESIKKDTKLYITP